MVLGKKKKLKNCVIQNKVSRSTGGDGCTFNKDPRVSRMIKNDGGMTTTARDGQIYRIFSGKDSRDLK